MTDQEILEKAIQKAIDGGWLPGWQDRRPIVKWGAQYAKDYEEGEGVMISGYHAKSNASMWFFPIKELIFNHDFAKALWGEGKEVVLPELAGGTFIHSLGDNYSQPNPTCAWQYHLQQLVVAENPIRYLGGNLDG